MKAKDKQPARRERHPGKRPSQLWLTPEDYATIEAAAKLTRRSIVNFCTLATLKTAREVTDAHQAGLASGHIREVDEV